MQYDACRDGKALNEAKKTYNRTLGMLRLLGVYAVVAALVLLSRPTPLSVSVGFVFVAAGEAIRFWASGHLHKTVELVTAGPYRHTRNPLYLGRLLIFTGLCVMALLPFGANWLVLGLGYVVFFGYYMPRKERVEPARLREAHGEAYQRYYSAVPAIFPSPRPYSPSAASVWSSNRMMRNREHWMALGLFAVCLFLLWRAYALAAPV